MRYAIPMFLGSMGYGLFEYGLGTFTYGTIMAMLLFTGILIGSLLPKDA